MSTILPINLDALLHCRGVESERVEFKASWDPDTTGPQVLRTICAFANDCHNLNGGYVVAGVAERDGRPILPPIGLSPEEIETAQRWIRGHCHRLDPPCPPILSPETVGERLILVVWAPASEMRPHRAPARDGTSRYWIRPGIVRERLIRDGAVHGPARNGERLVSRGCTNARKTLAANYTVGGGVAFHRPCKRLGVEKGDELRVAGVDHKAQTVKLEASDGRSVVWAPGRVAARSGGIEVYRVEDMELRAGDRICRTRNDAGLGLDNSQTAEVTGVKDGQVTFRLEDGRVLDLRPGDPQLRHIDRARASTRPRMRSRAAPSIP